MLSSKAINTTGALIVVASILLFGQGGSITQGAGLPSQAGNGGKYLQTNGTVPSWQSVAQTGSLFYFMTPNASDISGDLAQTTAAYSPSTPLTLPSGGFSGTGTFTVQDWATPVGAPGQAFFPAGSYVCHVHANRTNPFVGTLVMQCTFIEVSSTGVVIGTIGTTDPTVALTNVNTEYEEDYLDPNPYTLASTSSRIVTRVQAVCTSCPASTQLVINVGANTDTHIVLPAVQAPSGVQSVAGLTGVVPGVGTDANIMTGVPGGSLGMTWCVDSNGGATTSGCHTGVRSFGSSFDGGGSALASGKTTYTTVPFNCTISAWNIVLDTGTATVDIWRIATGTAIPTVANSITAGAPPAISSGTAIHSTTTTGWCGTGTCAVTPNDIFGFNLQAVASATYVNLVVECDQ